MAENYRSPDGVKRNPGAGFPDSTAFHPGYIRIPESAGMMGVGRQRTKGLILIKPR
jgi:hypothetical protein